jgi:caffeoyl-CoA O-methyltransferase
MKKYPLSYETLHQYSQQQPFARFDNEWQEVFTFLETTRKELDFPAVTKDVGQLLSFLTLVTRPKVIFEFGSGYGQSAFWYLQAFKDIDKIYLTEKNPNLIEYYNQVPWPTRIKEKLDYFQGNAFDRFDQVDSCDLILIDGLKATYLDFLKKAEKKISAKGVVVIDNAYWRGSFLDPEFNQAENSAKAIKELHDYIQKSDFWVSTFLPYQDGVILLTPSL